MARPHKFIVSLTTDERNQLEQGCRSGSWGPRKVKRAKVLLLTDSSIEQDNPPLTTEDIAKRVGCAQPTVVKTRKRFKDERLGALEDTPRSGRPKKIDGEVEAKMIAIACSETPEGREHWTLRLIADKLVTLVDDLKSISYTAVGKALKKTNSNPGLKKSGK